MDSAVIIAANDYDNVSTELRKIRIEDGSDYLSKLEQHGKLLINVVELKQKMACDVLIIEDNPGTLINYFRIFEKFPMVKYVIACTKRLVFEEAIEYITDFRRIKLVIMDFDLDSGLDNKKSAEDALFIYEKVCEIVQHTELRVIGITGFENNYDSRNYRILEDQIKKSNDYVLNKKFLDPGNLELLENILRNVPAIDFDWDKNEIKLNDSVSKTKTNDNSFQIIERKTGYPKGLNEEKLENARLLLDRINDGIKNACPNNETFNITLHFGFIKSLKNKKNSIDSFMKDYRSVTGQVSVYKNAILYLLNDKKNQGGWPFLRFQIANHRLFENQLIKEKSYN